MTPENRSIARGVLVRIRDMAHHAINTLDRAEDMALMGDPASAAVPALCAVAGDTVEAMRDDMQWLDLNANQFGG